MTEDNIKGFTIEWILVGLLLFCLLSFTFSFMYYNSDHGLDSNTNSLLNGTSNDIKVKLFELDNESNALLNVTSNTNPEVSQLGSRDSVATAYGYKGSTTSTWNQFKTLIGWIFSGDMGKVLIATLGGILGFLGLYYIIKSIRTGI